MQFIYAKDPEACSLRDMLVAGARVLDRRTEGASLSAANLWLYDFSCTPPVADAREAIASLLGDPVFPARDRVVTPPHANNWFYCSDAAASNGMISLLLDGVGDEPGVLSGDLHAARAFVQRIVDWVGSPLSAFSNLKSHAGTSHRYGFVVVDVGNETAWIYALVGTSRLAILCCISDTSQPD